MGIGYSKAEQANRPARTAKTTAPRERKPELAFDRLSSGAVEVQSAGFLTFLHQRGLPCPLFAWNGQEPLEAHHVGMPGLQGWGMRRKQDGLAVLIPRSVHARHTTWESENGGQTLAAARVYALADFLSWLDDPSDFGPRVGDPLTLIFQASLSLASSASGR